MEMVTVNGFGSMELRKIQNSFDTNVAGQFATNKKYYCIMRDYKTKKLYAITTENKIPFDENNVLAEGEQKIINGNLVRGMTYEEEELWNENRLMSNVDCYGNVEVNDTFDREWYMENCI